jgi:hypothetical protein
MISKRIVAYALILGIYVASDRESVTVRPAREEENHEKRDFVGNSDHFVRISWYYIARLLGG